MVQQEIDFTEAKASLIELADASDNHAHELKRKVNGGQHLHDAATRLKAAEQRAIREGQRLRMP
jgi:hypothetical protein